MDDVLELAAQVGKMLKQKGARLVTAESCTGGGVAQAITEIPGSSDWFVGAYVAYANDCKTTMLNVSASDIMEHGAVSEAVAVAMARGALSKTQATVAVSTTGIAGPTGGVPGKPVGTVWMACATADVAQAECQVFGGDRQAVRLQTIAHVLRLLLGMAEKIPDKTLAEKS